MYRRDFIKIMSVEAAALLFFEKVQAQEWGHDDWQGFFVTILMTGAWDISLSLDPWIKAQRPDEKEFFIEYTADKLLSWGQSALGPAMQVMSPHFQDISVINGVFMSTNDNGHDSLLSYALTGDPLNKRGAFGLELNATLPDTLFSVLTRSPIPTGERANKVTDFSSAESALNGDSGTLADTFIQNANSGILNRIREAQKDQSKLAAAKEFFKTYKTSLNGNTELNYAAVTAASFKAGLSRTAVMSPSLNLDSHSNHPILHMSEQIKGWTQINEIFKLFKSIEYKDGKSLFDMTTFFVTSEFSRTPALNTAKGKDHNPWTNSVLLAGRGIKGGVVQGGSHLVTKAHSSSGNSYVTGLSFDYENSRVIESRADLNQASSAILPQNVLRTAADAMGLNLNVLGGGLYKAAPFKNILRS